MKILSWNVNSVATVRGYEPWRGKTWKQILDALDADIICFQETKVSRATVVKTPEMAVAPGYDAFFSFCKSRPGSFGGGYSGVATYVRTERIPTPVDAEEGFLNTLGQKPASKIGNYGSLDAQFTQEELDALDSEGRCVITDHRLFVLFNVYFPNDATDERHLYKMSFYRAMETRVRALLAAGRQVVIVGDVNTTHEEIDHADPKKSMKECGIENFMDLPSRKWIHNFLVPNGPMVDVFRLFHPDRTKAFTCWNTKIDARAANYGSRIDYVLSSHALTGYWESSEVHQDIRGSDHCPVSGTFKDELYLDDRGNVVEEDTLGATKVRLVDLLEPRGSASRGGAVDERPPRDPPPLCTRFWEEFSGKQKKLSNFFTTVAVKSEDGGSGASFELQSGTQPQQQQETVSGEASTSTSAPPLIARRDSQPSSAAPKGKVASWTSPGKGKKGSGSGSGKKKVAAGNNGAAAGQMSLLSFMAKPAGAGARGSPDPAETVDLTTVTTTAPDSASASQETADPDPPAAAISNSAPPTTASGPDPPLSPTSPFLVHNEPVVKQAWSSIFQPKPTPLCYHGEPTKEWVTNKPGPNKGRAFYLCQRPVGPEEEGTEKGVFGSKKRKGLKIGQFKCDFFAWKKGKKGSEEGGESESKKIKTGSLSPKKANGGQSSQEPDIAEEWPSDFEDFPM